MKIQDLKRGTKVYYHLEGDVRDAGAPCSCQTDRFAINPGELNSLNSRAINDKECIALFSSTLNLDTDRVSPCATFVCVGH